MTEIVLFHVLAATGGAAFGMLAIWAGFGRLHWSVRFIPVAAVIVSLFPVPAFDLALVFVSQALVVAVPLILVRRFTAPPADGTATVTAPPSQPWRRFSVADLFRATLLIAAVFGVAAYLPGDVRASWWKYTLVGAGFGVATLAGAWTALARRHWWLRLGGLCIAAPLAGVPTALDWRTYVYFRESEWAWCAVTAAVGVQVTLWLMLTEAAGWTGFCRTKRHSSKGVGTIQSVAVVRRRLAMSGLAVVSLAILLLPVVAYHDMLHAPSIPASQPPEPNAYDDLLRIAVALKSIGPPGGSLASEAEQQVSPDQHRRVLFDELHAALRRPGAVPFRRDIDSSYLPNIQSLRQLSRDLLADGDRHRLAGNTIDAQRRYLDLVELGPASSRGGWLVDRMLGTAFERMGIEGLRQLRESLSRDQRRALIDTLQAHEADWEPAADVLARELANLDRIVGWPARVSFLNPFAMIQATEQADDRRSATLRLLICETALAQYLADHGAPPAQLPELVPEYLSDVPDDPFSGRPLVYRTGPNGYVLYSVDQNCLDDGGRRGTSLTDGDLFLDPAPPPTDDGAGED